MRGQASRPAKPASGPEVPSNSDSYATNPGYHRTQPEWRNWQTRGTQNPVSLGTCGFDPHLRHLGATRYRDAASGPEAGLAGREVDATFREPKTKGGGTWGNHGSPTLDYPARRCASEC